MAYKFAKFRSRDEDHIHTLLKITSYECSVSVMWLTTLSAERLSGKPHPSLPAQTGHAPTTRFHAGHSKTTILY